MLLNTISCELLVKSIADILCTDIRTIIEFFDKKATGIINGNYNEYTINYLDLGTIKKIFGYSKMQIIDEVVVNHITPRKNYNTLMSEDILTLPQALISDTELSQYLKKKGLDLNLPIIRF